MKNKFIVSNSNWKYFVHSQSGMLVSSYWLGSTARLVAFKLNQLYGYLLESVDNEHEFITRSDLMFSTFLSGG